MVAGTGSKKCPVCGLGDLVDISYRDDPAVSPDTDEPIQTAETRQVETFSCGHEIDGPRLDQTAAGTDELEAERRESGETTEPL
jgi:thiol-disulfide isomerase/thioredoxin